MLTDVQLRAMEASAPLLVAEVRKLRDILHDADTTPWASWAQDMAALKDQVAGLSKLVESSEKVIKAQDDLIKTQELQIHDNQTLREDYEKLVTSECDAMLAVDHYKDAAIRDEETIKELKALIVTPVKSETFKEVRDERDLYLRMLQGVNEELARWKSGSKEVIEALLITAGVRGLAK